MEISTDNTEVSINEVILNNNLNSIVEDVENMSIGHSRLEELAQRLRCGEFKKIIVLTGAGISTSSGIPDFRSENGLFGKVKKLFGSKYPALMTDPERAFSRSFQTKNPEVNIEDIKDEFLMRNAKPSPAHMFFVKLHEKGWLRRVYTQNIDGLHSKSGLPDEKVIEVHGSIAKNNIVLYEDPLPPRFFSAVNEDFKNNNEQVDLILVMGTSLQVAPFCALPNLVRKECTRALITLNAFECFSNNFSKKSSGGFYSQNFGPSSTKLAGRRVTLKPQWVKGKYKDQFIFDMDVDLFTEKVALE